MADREILIAKAKELDIEVSDEMADSEIGDLITLKDDSIDLDNLKLDKKEKDKSDDEDIEYYKTELAKAIDSRDKNKTERRKLAEKIDALEDSLDDAPKKEDIDTLKEELTSLKEFKKEMDDKDEEKLLEDATELERANIKFGKQLKEITDRMDAKDNEVSKIRKEFDEKEDTLNTTVERLRGRSLSAEIGEVAAVNKAFNPNQIVRILKDEFTYDKDLDKFVYFVRNEKGKIVDELDVAERVKEFLTSEENENLLKTDIKSGTGHAKGDGDDKKLKKSPDSIYDPNDESIIRAAESRGMSVEDHIWTLELKDEKRKVIEEKRKAQ